MPTEITQDELAEPVLAEPMLAEPVPLPDLSVLADQLVNASRTSGVQLTGPAGLLTGLTRQVLETALDVEMTEHLGHERHERSGAGNVRNGSSPKTVRTDVGEVRISVPRARTGSFAPVVVPKHSRRLAGFDDAVLSLYAKGLTTGDIVNHLADVYGTQVSRDLVSRVTDAVLEQMAQWQNRPLDAVYPVLLIDAIVLKIRDGQVANRPVYLAMGITVDGERDVLGLGARPIGGEGAKQWISMRPAEGPARRDRRDLAAGHGPACVVHLVRNSLRYASKRTGRRSPAGSRRSTPR